jgi:hypothetical protein
MRASGGMRMTGVGGLQKGVEGGRGWRGTTRRSQGLKGSRRMMSYSSEGSYRSNSC